MKPSKRKAIEAAGWKVGDAADFLEMNEQERQLLETRAALAKAVRRQREIGDLTQKELGARLKTSQPRIVKIEQAASDVSVDQLIRALMAAGGRLVVKSAGRKRNAKGKAKKDTAIDVVFEVTVD